MFAGWAPSTPLLHEIARTARNLPPTGDPPDSAANLLLRGCTARVTGGYAAAVPPLRRTVQAFLADEVDPDVALQRLELAAVLAADLLDDASVERLTADWIDRARASGALARLAAALAFRSAYVDGPAGQLAAARAAEAEAHELAEVTGNPGVVPPTGAHTLLTLALSGREAEARATAAAVSEEAPGRGAAGEMAMAASFLGVLEISLGNYGSALAGLERRTPTTRRSSEPRHCPTWWRPPSAPGGETWQNARCGGWRTARPRPAPPSPSGCSPAPGPCWPPPTEAGQRYEDALHLLGRTRATPSSPVPPARRRVAAPSTPPAGGPRSAARGP